MWLGVGAVIAVGSAWGSSKWWGLVEPRFASSKVVWPHSAPASWPEAPDSGMRDWTFWNDYENLYKLDSDTISYFAMFTWQVGWPWRCLHAWTTSMWSGGQQLIEDHGTWVFKIGSHHFGPLPVLPLWPGIALNTIFYAAIAWGLWRIPVLLRRARRRRRGWCIRCAYDRAGLAPGSPCPECGCEAPAAPRSASGHSGISSASSA